MISAIILVHDAEPRQTSPLALSCIGDKTVLQYMVDALQRARVMDIIIVLDTKSQEIQSSLSWFEGKIVVNQSDNNNLHTSIRLGINALNGEDLHGALICPINVPFLSQSLIVDVLQGFWRSRKKIIIPLYGGKRGHPLIFGKNLFEEIHKTPSLETMIQHHETDIHEATTDEEGAVITVTSISDLASKHGQQTL